VCCFLAPADKQISVTILLLLFFSQHLTMMLRPQSDQFQLIVTYSAVSTAAPEGSYSLYDRCWIVIIWGSEISTMINSMPLHVFTIHIQAVKSTMNKPASLLSCAKCGHAGALTPKLVSGTMCSCPLRSSFPSSEPRQSKMAPSWTHQQSLPYRSAFQHSDIIWRGSIFANLCHI